MVENTKQENQENQKEEKPKEEKAVKKKDSTGNVVAWSSAGTAGFKGSRKGTPFAAQMAAESVAKKALDAGVKKIGVYVKGPGAGREAAIRALQATWLEIDLIRD